MALSAGTRLGPYEILAPLGAGGMGEVYRARDTRLDRTVAVKVLPAELAADPQLKARFEREARAISALAHPNICTLHDVGEQDGRTFLVMEHLAGQTLAERLKKGRLPLELALEVATQVADALSAAHKQGIIHRDLKPGNVMLTKTGARLLDFGLARLTGHGEQPAVGSLTSAPTEPEPLTGRGTVMGTLPYMAPEQVEGKPADARTDLWALGAILYEMLSGERAFQASSPVSLVGAILEREPAPLKERRPLTPPSLERLVRRCLAKDPDDRWDTAHDVAAELRWVAEIGGQVSAPEATPPRARSTVIWVLSVVVAAALGALVASWVGEPSRSNGTVVATPFHAVIELPDDIPLAIGERPQMGSGPSVTVSPDGSTVVYVGETSEGQQLYLRPMNSYEVTPIPGTEGGARPFFSPDGRWVGFLTTDKVKKVSLQGGAPLTLCDARSPVRARWTRDDMIFFVDNQGTSVSRVPAAGGVPVALQPSQALIARVSQVLPDGKWALQSFPDGISSDHASIRLVSLDTGETRELVKSGFDARYIPTGHLIFARSGNLLAVPFDLDRLQVVGEAVPVVSNVSMEPLTGAAQQVAESDSGTLVYVPGGDTSVGKLAWVDRQGTPEFLPVPERQYGAVDLAPGGARLAVHVADVNDYIWIYDITREEGRKLRTTEGAGWPVWTPDGKDVAFSTTGEGLRGILKQAVDDAGPPVELSRSAVGYPQSWSPDGAVLAERARRAQGPVSVTFHRLDGEPGPEWSRPAGSDAWGHVFSPDGRWVAYASDETGRYEIWVRSYPEGDTARQISVEGGIEPLWCDDCDELFFRKGNRWMSSTVTLGPELSWETPRLAFETEFVDTPGRSYDVSADGQRLLVVKSTREPVRTKLHVIQNWFTELNRLVPVN